MEISTVNENSAKARKIVIGKSDMDNLLEPINLWFLEIKKNFQRLRYKIVKNDCFQEEKAEKKKKMMKSEL